MIYIADNSIIKVNRGDSFSVPLMINRGTTMDPEPFIIQENPGTKVYMGVMEPNQPFERAIIRKAYDSTSEVDGAGNLLIKFVPEDTIALLPGKYYYQIKVVLPDGEVNTIVPNTLFCIC